MRILTTILLFVSMSAAGQPVIIDDTVQPTTGIVDPTVTNNLIDKAFTGDVGIVFIVLLGIIGFLLFQLHLSRRDNKEYIGKALEMAVETNKQMEAARHAYENLNNEIKELRNTLKNG